MKTNELREKSGEELRDTANALRENLFRAKMKHRTGQLASPSELKSLRKDIARVETVLTERAK